VIISIADFGPSQLRIADCELRIEQQKNQAESRRVAAVCSSLPSSQIRIPKSAIRH